MNESTECRSRERERERARARMRFPFEEACVCFCVFCDVHGGLHAPRVGFCGLPSVMKEDGECCVWWRHGCSAGNVLDPLDCFSVGLAPTATLLSLCGLVGGGGNHNAPLDAPATGDQGNDNWDRRPSSTTRALRWGKEPKFTPPTPMLGYLQNPTVSSPNHSLQETQETCID